MVRLLQVSVRPAARLHPPDSPGRLRAKERRVNTAVHRPPGRLLLTARPLKAMERLPRGTDLRLAAVTVRQGRAATARLRPLGTDRHPAVTVGQHPMADLPLDTIPAATRHSKGAWFKRAAARSLPDRNLSADPASAIPSS